MASQKRDVYLRPSVLDRLMTAPNTLIGLPPNPKHPIPAGGLVSSGDDLAKLYRMMLNGGELDGKRVVSAKAVAEMTKLQTGEIKTGFVDGMGYGFGFAHVREPKGVTAMLSAGSYGHGGAFGTQKLDAKDIQALAKLPSLDELRAKIVGMLKTPATRIACVLQAPGGQVARVIAAKARKEG